VVYYLFFIVNFDHTTIVNLVSDFTCFLLIFSLFFMSMDLHGSILLSSGSFAPKFWKMIKMQFNAFWCKELKIRPKRTLWFGRQNSPQISHYILLPLTI